MKNRLAEFIYSVCYIGYIPRGSGTVASAVVVALVYLLQPPIWVLWLAFAISLCLGVITSRVAILKTGKKDPHVVVIDEAAGMLLILATVPRTLLVYFLAFAFFRFFDIVKLFPIRRSESLRGEWGIMVDDLIAGLYSIGVVWFFFFILYK